VIFGMRNTFPAYANAEMIRRVAVVSFLSLFGVLRVNGVQEVDRVVEYQKRFGNSWPPESWDTSPGWSEWVSQEESKLEKISNRDERWFSWLNLIQSMAVPKISDLGFELVDVPEHIYKELRELALNKPLESIPFEREVDRAGIEPQPRFLDTTEQNDKILGELQKLHEEWAGMSLTLSRAYGLRFYLNESTLVWHLDKLETHVVSGILHIASDPDQETAPWPLEIVGHDGKEHKIILKPGQLLFYESAKLSHGRPSTFNGNWYTSVFLHYRPKLWAMRREDLTFMVPPHWVDGRNLNPHADANAKISPEVHDSL